MSDLDPTIAEALSDVVETASEEAAAEVVEEAASVVALAETAVALAGATEAAAELQAAETIRQVEDGANEWRVDHENRLMEAQNRILLLEATLAEMNLLISSLVVQSSTLEPTPEPTPEVMTEPEATPSESSVAPEAPISPRRKKHRWI